jgi:tetratricopeptide (TPR) repeat protein
LKWVLDFPQHHKCDRYLSTWPAELDVYGRTQLGYAHYYLRSATENDAALRQFDDVLQISRTYASALAGKAACHFWAGQQHWSDDAEQSLHHARDLAFRAVAAAPRLPWARLVMAQSELFLGRHDAAITAAKHATTLNPSDAASFAFLGHALTAAGKARPVIRILKCAFTLAPYHPNRFM